MPVPDGYGCISRSLLSFVSSCCRNFDRKEVTVSSRFRKLSHTIWHCQYHIVWVPKYRYRILHGPVKEAAESGIMAICGYAGCEVVELNVQPDHVHLVLMIPPKLAISDLLGRLKGQTSMKLFQQFRHLKKKPYWGNHFWAKGYCVDSVGLDADMIRKYVRFQEKKEQQMEQLQLGD
jgi:putative transposase